MQKFKKAIAGQIALVLISCHNYRAQMSRQDLDDYEDLARCQQLLSGSHVPESNFNYHEQKKVVE